MKHSTPRWPFAVLVLVSILTAASAAPAEAPPSAEGVALFETSIRPLLVEHCYACHSAGAKRLRGGLRLDSEQGWLKGGDLGPAVKPGDPEESLLIAAVRHEDEQLKMPPKGKLAAAEIALLTRWVAMGAPAPRGDVALKGTRGAGVDIEGGREFWAFRPPADPPMPDVADAGWCCNGLDRFVLAALEAKGLAPAPAADRRTLIRRATFDLTGLPPKPEEVDAFLGDEAPDAFARVVERLLASPHYGERWGRHWLDLARYADSNGLDENVAHGNAWRYRDYVIAAFNADKPYHQFVLEQLAGDLLPAAAVDPPAVHHERLIATGFLALGPKVLAEPDERKMEMDIVDEQVDTVGRTFFGMTLGCARCHDHKFDPIATADYYGLAGVFKSTRTMETFKKVAKWYEHSLAAAPDLARKSAHDQKVAAANHMLQDLVATANEQLRYEGGEGFELPKMAEKLYPRETRAELKRLRDELAALAKSAPEMPAAMGVAEGSVADTPLLIRGSYLTPGALVPRRVPRVLASGDPCSFTAAQSGRLELARWLTTADHPLTSRVMVNRIWRWHFGQGLVATPDNFGALGARPSNPALLDWLAHRFTASGWSIKAMHRLIMLSSAYQMASDENSRAAQIDPENRLNWRMNVRRLEAEEIRDSLLAVAGSLDRRMGGSLLAVKNRAYFFDHTSKDATTYDSLRRSVYLPVVRNHLYDVFQLFDYADPSVTSGDRATTTVAPQALFMINGDLVLQSARDLATALFAQQALDDAGRIVRLYETAYGRPPAAAESRRAAVYLDRFARVLQAQEKASADARRLEAWQALCQVILASNEFVFIR
jgi:mono/diheme cytochrome c family protein